MTTLVLSLQGPLQAWGLTGRFQRRDTHPRPTKSGILGLIAAAAGTRRGQDGPISAATARLTVRTDSPGQLRRDYHTIGSAHPNRMPVADGSPRRPGEAVLTERWYIEDGTFTAFVESNQEAVELAESALQSPIWQLSLGRRSCPPSGPVLVGITEQPAATLVDKLPLLRHPTRDATVAISVATESDHGALIMDSPHPGSRRQFEPRFESLNTLQFDADACAGTGVDAWRQRRAHVELMNNE